MRCRFVVPALAAIVLAGCAASSRVQSTLGNKYRYSASMIEPEKSRDMLYRDEHLIIQFRLDDPGIRFQAQNISPDTMRIDWARATIGIHGMTSPVRTMATFYDTTRSQPASQMIPSLGVVRDVILPRAGIYFDGSRWRIDDLLPTTDANTHAMRTNIANFVGSRIEVQLPIDCGSDSRMYEFALSVDSVKQIAWSEYRPPSWIPTSPPLSNIRATPKDNITAVIIAGGFLGILRYMMTMNKTPVVE